MYATLEQTVEKENYGHSTAVIGIDIALQASVRKLILFHHEPECDDSQIAKSFSDAREYLRNRQLEYPDSKLSVFASYDGLDYRCLVRLKNPHAKHVVMFLRLYLIMFLKSRWRSHKFGERPPPLAVDTQIQVISLLFRSFRRIEKLCIITFCMVVAEMEIHPS